MHLSVQDVLTIDLCTVIMCSLVALRCASSVLHPSFMMLGCHGYIVTVRLFQLLKGSRPMSYTFAWPVATSEILRAALASDLALVAMALAWLVVRYWGRLRANAPHQPRILLSKPRVRAIAVLAMLAYVGAIVIVGPHNLTAGLDPDPTPGYLNAAAGWGPWACCLLHYIYGFPLPLLGVTAVTLTGTMLLSRFRGVVIIPLIFLLFTWLARRGQKRPPLALIPAVGLLWLIWLPMKPIVYSLQAGKSVGDSFSTGIEEAFGHFGEENGSGIDFQFLDMIGSTMTLVDVHGSHFWGSSLAPLVTSLVPRNVWPDKPHLNEYQLQLDIPSRNMAHMNMTAGLVGEAYADFGYFGVFAIPFLISLAFSFAWARLAGTNLLSPGGLLYLIFFSTFMQLYRDGLISAVWFPFVNCAPMGFTAVLHWLWPPRLSYRWTRRSAPVAAGSLAS